MLLTGHTNHLPPVKWSWPARGAPTAVMGTRAGLGVISTVSYRLWARASPVSLLAHLNCKIQDFSGSPMAKTALPVQGAGIQMPQLKSPHTTGTVSVAK